jgi:hypothetical protein
MLYPVIKCEWGSKKVVEPRDKPLEQILQQKWCSDCRRRGCWRSLPYDESRWDQ